MRPLERLLRQHKVISRARLLSGGVSPGAISHALAQDKLRQVVRGIYVQPDLDPNDREVRWLAGLVATEPDGVLSHGTAAAARGLRRARPEEPVHITVPHGRGRPSLPGAVVHQTGDPDYESAAGWPVCGVRAMAVGMAGGSLDEFRFATLAAVQRGLVPAAQLADETGVPRRALGNWRIVAEEATAGAQSGPEGLYWRAVADAGLPLPLLNHPVSVGDRHYRVDALWAEWGLVVEIDGFEFHGGAEQFERDRTRQNDLHSLGLVVVRFPARQVIDDPREVVAMTRANLIARGYR